MSRAPREVEQLVAEQLDLLRGDRRAALVDLGLLAGGRVDHRRVRARLLADAHEVVEDRLLGELLDDARAGRAAGEAGGDHGLAERLERARDVDALAARPSCVCSTERWRRPSRKFGTASVLSIAALSVTVMIMRLGLRAPAPSPAPHRRGDAAARATRLRPREDASSDQDAGATRVAAVAATPTAGTGCRGHERRRVDDRAALAHDRRVPDRAPRRIGPVDARRRASTRDRRRAAPRRDDRARPCGRRRARASRSAVARLGPCRRRWPLRTGVHALVRGEARTRAARACRRRARASRRVPSTALTTSTPSRVPEPTST